MQFHALLAPCIRLRSRPRDFDVHELSALTKTPRVVGLHPMRSTAHLVTERPGYTTRGRWSPAVPVTTRSLAHAYAVGLTWDRPAG